MRPEGEQNISGPRFDPSHAITFDLARGTVQLQGAPLRVLVPADALVLLCRAAGPGPIAAFGRSIGEAMGRRVASRLSGAGPGAGQNDGSAVRGATLETVVEHLGGEIALAGLGSLGLERWGRAMVMLIDQSPLGIEGDTLLETMLEGAIETATGKKVRARCLARDGVRARFFIGSERATYRVRAWLMQGVSWGEVLARLHAMDTPGSAKERTPGAGGGA
jgi:hypothetical protein